MNFFDTLNDALNAEGLIESWECTQIPIAYGETRSYTWQDGSKYGHYVTIYRDNKGRMKGPCITSDRPKPREGYHRHAVTDEVN
jgi:hypothetical protein